MSWIIKSILFSFSIFIVWKNVPSSDSGIKRKERIIIDIRALNKIIITDAYLIPL